MLVPKPFPLFARSNFKVPALIFCAVVLKAVALSDARTLCPAIAATEMTIAAPASGRQVLFFFVASIMNALFLLWLLALSGRPGITLEGVTDSSLSCYSHLSHS